VWLHFVPHSAEATVRTAHEKLGVFYLGRTVDPGTGAVSPEPLLYESKDLTTHAVCVGMTGSGKTGLCVGLLEEAAMDRLPAIVIDPKGDVGNLLLTFPDLAPGDFRPWVDEAEALRKGMTPDDYAKDRAALWKKGLAEWDQDGDRIRRLREAADFAIYTPGGRAGIPVRALGSLAAPPPAVRDDPEAMAARIGGVVSGLLVLLGIDADPVRSREYILLSNILDHAWRAGRSLDLPGLIRQIQEPPFAQVGVFDVESFFPSKDRFGLAMAVNNVMASPGFAVWMEGEPLDIDRFLYTPAGKPRIAVMSIAHLGEAERMFFVTLLLNEVVSWMRVQPGTGSLRALLYMDEVFGYLPPVANPPSKPPMLTLLKQARAYGVGVVLATQNPVDLDYKALSNAGTWFLGRLQTEQDKARVLDGLEGASTSTGAAFERAKVDAMLSGLGSRVFLMSNAHDDAPVLFHTRWAMSYLRGPMTRAQIAKAMATPVAPAATVTAGPAVASAATVAGSPPPGAPAPPADADRPVLAPGIPEVFLAADAPVAAGPAPLYRPALLGRVRVHYASSPAGVDEWKDLTLLAPLTEDAGADVWDAAEETRAADDDVPAPGARFAPLPAAARQEAAYPTWTKMLASYVYRARPLVVWKCAATKAYSRPGETEAAFRARLDVALRERRDIAYGKIKLRYATKLATLQDRIRTAEQRVERETAQHGQQKLTTAVALGATVLSALFGRKTMSVGNVSRAGSALKSAGRVGREAGDVERAKETLDASMRKLADLEADLQAELDKVEEGETSESLDLAEVIIRPRKADLVAGPVQLAWVE
jgi:hypothetical protein